MNPKATVRMQSAQRHELFDTNGFLIITQAVSMEDCDSLGAELTFLFNRNKNVSRRKIGGVRNILRQSQKAADIASSDKFISLLNGLTGRRYFPVKAIFFDKNPGSNWSVPWHQDLAIAVVRRIESPGFGPWSVKEGIVHVQPPQHILGNMITLRLHLDDCPAGNGALRIIQGSHLHGELDSDAITKWATHDAPVVCELSKGDALLMKPLLLHSSPQATNPNHRRILHIEYASDELPDGLEWFDRPKIS